MLEDVVGFALVVAIVLMIIGSIVSSLRRRKQHHEATIAEPVHAAWQSHANDHNGAA